MTRRDALLIGLLTLGFLAGLSVLDTKSTDAGVESINGDHLVFLPLIMHASSNGSAGYTVSAISGDTTESGGTATFTIVLNTQPTANVTV
ncbi:MAG: hypothetical protein GTO18_17225, partial [Anaerolineales bacterium]|nr:hypothetical protein [Anaerolineales bacterium]